MKIFIHRRKFLTAISVALVKRVRMLLSLVGMCW